MLQTFFLWFYCLPIAYVVLLMTGFGVLYHLLRKYLPKTHLRKPGGMVLLFFSILVIVCATLTDRTPGAITEPRLKPFYSLLMAAAGEKEFLRESFMNIVLFYPTGLLACGLLPERWNRAGKVFLVVLLSACLSAGIEFSQFQFALGRAEVDDVIHNTLGAFIGAMVSCFDFDCSHSKG